LKNSISLPARAIACFSAATYLLFWASAALGRPPEDKLYKSLSQLSVTEPREPSQGAIRTAPKQTDIRTVFQGPDGREGIITIWSPRVHPFKAPPSYVRTRPCLFGEYFETTIGLADITKTHLLRQSGRDQKYPHAFEWSDTRLASTPTIDPPKAPQEKEFIGKVFEFEKTGRCNYHPIDKKETENAKIYFYKHLEIAKRANATDIIFPKTLFNLISQSHLTDPSYDYELPLRDLNDIRLEFNGSTFLLPPNRGGFIFTRSHRVALSQVTLEWAKPKTEDGKSYSGPIVHGIFSPNDNNSDLWFESISMKRVPGWGFYFDSTAGILISDSSISSVDNETFPAAREGAIHVNGSQNIIIRDNTFDQLGGDGINLHGQFASITTPPFQPPKKNLESGFSNCVGLGSYWRPYTPGETLGFFNSKMEFQGEIKIRSVSHFSFADPKLPKYCKGYSFCSEACFGLHPEFQPKESGYVASVSQESALFIIHGNTISNIQGRGLSVQGSNGIISENQIIETSGPGLQLGAELANRLQGPGAFNLLIKNNLLKRNSTDANLLQDQSSLYGAIALGVTRLEPDGRITLLNASLVQNIRFEGNRSLVEDSGSVALQIASSRNIEISSLLIGAAGLVRSLSSGTILGSPAEGSILVSRSHYIDLSGLTTPPLAEPRLSRNRTIVIDGQSISHLRLPLLTQAIRGKTANTLWNLTFRSFFKEDLGKKHEPISLTLEGPALSTFYQFPPVAAYTVTTPKVGDKEVPILGKQLPLETLSSRWVSTTEHFLHSPNRIQIRPLIKKKFSDLFLSIDSVNMSPKKSNPLPFES